jgi:hypothetical protein
MLLLASMLCTVMVLEAQFLPPDPTEEVKSKVKESHSPIVLGALITTTGEIELAEAETTTELPCVTLAQLSMLGQTLFAAWHLALIAARLPIATALPGTMQEAPAIKAVTKSKPVHWHLEVLAQAKANKASHVNKVAVAPRLVCPLNLIVKEAPLSAKVALKRVGVGGSDSVEYTTKVV